MKALPIIELSKVIQGEGKLMGVPHLLIRFTGCRLFCKFSESICDTAYASWYPEKGKYSLEEVIGFLLDNKEKFQHVLITGGEPYLHSKTLFNLLPLLKSYHFKITIETAGTDNFDFSTFLDILSLSPKLSNSTPHGEGKRIIKQHEKWRKKYRAMRDLIKYQILEEKDYFVKFVYSNFEDLKEIKKVQKILKVPNNKIYLMPEGTTEEMLQKRRKALVKICLEEGYNYSERLHILIFGNIKGV